jgi:hypothetical protein
MVIQEWKFNQDEFETQLHVSYNVCLEKLLNDDIIDQYQFEEAYRYAPRVLVADTLVGWLKKKLFPEENTAGKGKHICVRLYDTYEEDVEDEGDAAIHDGPEEDFVSLFREENLSGDIKLGETNNENSSGI